MRDRLLKFVAQAVVNRPKHILLIGLMITVIGAAIAPGIQIAAGYSSLFSPNDPTQKRFYSFLKRFGSPSVMFLLIEGGDREARRALVTRLEQALPGRKTADRTARCRSDAAIGAAGCVRDVLGHIDLEQLKRYALLFLPQASIDRMTKLLLERRERIGEVVAARDIAELVEALTHELQQNAAAPEASAKNKHQAEAALNWISSAIGAVDARLRGDQRALSDIVLPQRLRSVSSAIDQAGYFVDREHKMSVVFVRPHNDADDPDVVTPFVGYVRRHAAALAEQTCKRQGCKSGPLLVTATGLPAMIADEREALAADLPLTSAVAAVGILLLFVFAFRSPRQGAIAMLPLLCAVVCALAFVRLSIGGLNMITSAFIPTMLGLGIDFSVHLLARYNESRWNGQSAVEAVRCAILRAGPGILTGALSTIGAFFALAVNRFKGFSDLGIVTGIGLTFSLLAIPMTAALLCSSSYLAKPPTKRKQAGLPIADWLARHRGVVLTGGIALTALMLWRIPEIPWSYKHLELMPEKKPSVIGMTKLAERTDFSGEIGALEASSRAEVEALVAALEQRATVGRIESIATFVPRDGDNKRKALAKLQPLIGTLKPGKGRPVDPATFRTRVQALTDEIEDARFAAKQAGHPFAKLLERPLTALKALLKTLDGTNAQQLRPRLAALQREIFSGRDQAVGILAANVTSGASDGQRLLDELPAAVAARLQHKKSDGSLSYAVYVYPRTSIWSDDMLPRFVADLRAVQPNATGYPVTHWQANTVIRAGFVDASAVAVGVLVLLLLFDFRNLRYTLYALVPLGFGIIWMLGGMAICKMSYNFANIIAFPLIVGIGVASGVHILHRFRQEGEREIAPVVRHTGMAILLSAATTMIGFGSLALAQHRGAASLGLVLLMGVGACLVASIVLLPALLHRSCERRNNRGEATPSANDS
ncbi:MAG: MMPL family transporter [Deltaproteobacteria bacterium]|nr:MMPL family transporter [Deltaproteobacteria bacterium]